MADFNQYFDAVSSYVTTLPASFDANTKLVLEAYNRDLEKIKATGEGQIPTFDEWRKSKEIKDILPALKDNPEAAKKVIDDAANLINANQKITDARNALVKDGKMMMTKAKGVFDGIMEFLQNNPITMAAMAIGGIAGNSLGFKAIGTIVLAIGGAIAGAVLGDGEKSFIGKLFGMGKTASPQNPGIITPGQAPTLSTLSNPENPIPAMESGKVLESTTAIKYTGPEVSATQAGQPAPDKLITVEVQGGRKLNLIGSRDETTGKFTVQYLEIADAKDEKKKTGYKPIPLTGADSIVLPMDEKGTVKFDAETSKKVIDSGNDLLKEILYRKTLPEPTTLGVALDGTATVKQGEHVKIVIRNASDKVVGEIEGFSDNGKFQVISSRITDKDNNPETLTNSERHQHIPTIPLDAEGKLQVNKALDIVREARQAEVKQMFNDKRDISFVPEDTGLTTPDPKKPDEHVITGKIKSTGNPTDIEIKVSIEGKGDERYAVITQPIKLHQGFEVKVPKPIKIAIGDLDISKPANQTKLFERIADDSGFRDLIRPIRSPDTRLPVVGHIKAKEVGAGSALSA